MITLRVVFVLAGLAMTLPGLAFLALFQPPHERRPHWVARALRILTASVVFGGLRVFVVNLASLNQPFHWVSAFDEATAVLTVFGQAAASILFLVVYVAYRKWPPTQ